jgi:hypothetical protein
MNVEEWMNEIEAACKNSGKELSKETRTFLMSDWINDPTPEQKKLYFDTMEMLLRYFFKKAAKGKIFGAVDRIKNELGKSVEENYGVSSGIFVDVARTYWSYKLETQDLGPKESKTIIGGLLSQTERTIAGTFFPFPGPIQDSYLIAERIKDQREILAEFAPEIDIENFLAENPMLK